MSIQRIATSAAGIALLAGCNGEAPEPAPSEAPTGDGSPVSILRPDVEQPPQAAQLSRLETRIGFPDGGSELSEEALAELATVRESPQMAQGGAIILRGHSDASGDDDANLRASRVRAEAVQDWLIEMGVEEERIRVIAFGEQNPIEPNALPDGTPNEKGREANRRVDVTVALPQGKREEPASAEEPAEDSEDD